MQSLNHTCGTDSEFEVTHRQQTWCTNSLVHQKKTIRVLAELNNRDSCRQKFKELKVLTVVCLYILEVATYASTLQLQRGTDRHKYNTRQVSNFTKIFKKINF
ncbi:hypothetical protein J6590_042166 [Homalodisca vitripennis]|nr:hypothetical protein J6590_042166 [Homalodisca vitripennis]